MRNFRENRRQFGCTLHLLDALALLLNILRKTVRYRLI